MLKPMKGYVGWAELIGGDEIVAYTGTARHDKNGDTEFQFVTQKNETAWLHVDKLYDSWDMSYLPHLGMIEYNGKFYTTPEYWNCDCLSIGNERYVHKKGAVSSICGKCLTSVDERPDSRVDEVLVMLNKRYEEAISLVQGYYDKGAATYQAIDALKEKTNYSPQEIDDLIYNVYGYL